MMESLWDGLSRDLLALPSPEWHYQALKEGDQTVAGNQAGFVSWDAAKKALRRNNS